MAAALTIDPATIFDNVDERRIEFTAAVDGETYSFAAQYDLLEALAAESPDDRPVALFRQHQDRVLELGAVALGRDIDQPVIVISENDLD